VAGLRGRAGGLGLVGRVAEGARLDGPGPRGHRPGRGDDHRAGAAVGPGRAARPGLRRDGRRRPVAGLGAGGAGGPARGPGGAVGGTGAGGWSRGWRRVGLGGLLAAMAVAAFLAPLASSQLDGLEFVGDRLGFLTGEGPALINGPLADYTVRGVPDVAPVT